MDFFRAVTSLTFGFDYRTPQLAAAQSVSHRLKTLRYSVREVMAA